MPLYEYTCSSCGKPFEKIMRFSEADLLPTCPHCGAEDTQKKISTIASSTSSNSSSFGTSGSSCGTGGGFT